MVSSWRHPLILASFGEEKCTFEKLSGEKHWAASVPCPCCGPGIFAMSDLRLLIDEKGRSKMDGYVNDCAGSVSGEGKNQASLSGDKKMTPETVCVN